MGINTGHIQTTDFVLEEPDIEFVVEVRAATLRDCGVQLLELHGHFTSNKAVQIYNKNVNNNNNNLHL